MWILLGERAETRLQLLRHRGEVGNQFEKVRITSNSWGQDGWAGKKWPPQDFAVSPSSSFCFFLIPNAFRERGFTGTNVHSSFFFPH